MSDSVKPSRNSEVQALRGILPDEELEVVHAYWMQQGADPDLAQSADDALIAVLREAGDGLADLGRMDPAFERIAEDIARRTVDIRSGMSSTDVGKTLGPSQVDGPTTAEPVPLAERDSAVIGPAPTKTLAEASQQAASARHAAASSEATFLSSSEAGDGTSPKLTVRDGRLATPTDEELVPGFQLGAYRIVRRLGQGGMGSVFLAEHIRMERLVALKTLAPDMTRDPQALKRFHREVKAAAKLSHPNIVTAYDADEAQGLQMLIMEYVEGTDLSVRVKRDGTMSVQDAIHSLLQAARGLEFAHSKGVVHRDIKPANLLMDQAGIVKVLDMGLARIGEVEESATAGLTTAGTIMGTAEFMAPEQALDTRTAGAPADIYSLGCTLYYLLTGYAPFAGDTVMKILLAHRDRDVPKLRAIRTDVPERLDSLFRRMMAKRVSDRCQAMTEVISELEAIQTELARVDASRSNDSATTLPGSIQFPEFARPLAPSTGTVASPPTPVAKGVAPPVWTRSRGLVAAASAGLLFLFGLVITLTTREGTLVLEVTEPNAKIEIDGQLQNVQVTRADGRETITIGVEPGTHQLKVQKDGFSIYTDKFEIGWGGTKSIKAELKPLNAKPEVELSSTVPEPSPSAAGAGTAVGAWDTPEFRQWLAKVKDLPAEELLEAVSKKMVELNPGFDGKLSHGFSHIPGSTPVIERGKVVEVGFSSPVVSNVAPLRAFGTLRSVSCAGSSNPAEQPSLLVDISPLRGMGIERFCGFWNKGLSDYAPVVGPQLRELLLEDTQATDLSPLRGIPLRRLDMSFNGVEDLRPLEGMPLERLGIAGHFDNRPGVRDLSPLKGMQLKSLFVSQNPRLADLSALAGMPIDEFIAAGTGIQSLEPLRGMSIRSLGLTRTRVSDLSPLEGMPLQVLEISETPVHDLSPLRGLPLDELQIAGCRQLSDFSALTEIALKRVVLDFDATRDTDWLQSIKTLETINGKPVAEFWKAVASEPTR
jgi:serine/threonine protein kinase